MIDTVNRPHEHDCDDCEYLQGNSVAVQFRKNDCEIRADVCVKKVNAIRLWGRVKTCENEPVEAALVKLLKMVCDKHGYRLEGVAHTITDCKGFYQFDICERDDHADYRVIVGKAATGNERIIHDCEACNPCCTK